MSEFFSIVLDTILHGQLYQQYLAIGVLIYIALMISVIIGLGRLAILFSTVENPKVESIAVFPGGITLQAFETEYTHELYPWLAQVFSNLGIFIFAGAIGAILLWGIIPFVLIQKTITASRKKRFG